MQVISFYPALENGWSWSCGKRFISISQYIYIIHYIYTLFITTWMQRAILGWNQRQQISAWERWLLIINFFVSEDKKGGLIYKGNSEMITISLSGILQPDSLCCCRPGSLLPGGGMPSRPLWGHSWQHLRPPLMLLSEISWTLCGKLRELILVMQKT